MQYFAAVAFADAETVLKMADVLVKVHSKAIGIEPVSGNRYDANDPGSQLWILITGWHSVLKAYEMFGPGKLSEADERQYWAECAIAAELQTCDPADVPRSRAEVKAYFEAWRPRLAASEATQRMMNHLLDGAAEVIPDGGLFGLTRPVVSRLLRAATVATLPTYMRSLAGVRQSRAADLAATAELRAVLTVLSGSTAAKRLVLGSIAPNALPLLEPHWQGIEPIDPIVYTPAQARERFGYARPSEAHHDLRAKQRERVFGRHERPTDLGIVESEDLFGAVQ